MIFLDPTADPENPASYNFAASDNYITSIIRNGAQVFYRIGRSGGGGADPVIDPPSNPTMDPAKYAEVVKHVAMHYNQGWASGFHYNIKYWEVWNEPEVVGVCWDGTAEQFYPFYEALARALKSLDPTIQVGGPAAVLAGTPGPWREGLLQYIKDHQAPFDFYSFHNYPTGSLDPYDNVRYAQLNRQVLDSFGFTNAKIILSEWNSDPFQSDDNTRRVQSMQNAAYIDTGLIYMLDSVIDAEFYYRGDSLFLGLFSGADGDFTHAARALLAWNALRLTPIRLPVTGTDTIGFATVAGRSSDGSTIVVLISNLQIDPNFLTEPPIDSQPENHVSSVPLTPAQDLKFYGTTRPDLLVNKNVHIYPTSPGFPQGVYLPPQNLNYVNNQGYNITINNLPWGDGAFSVLRFRLTQNIPLQLTDWSVASGGTATLSAALPPPAIELIILHALGGKGHSVPLNNFLHELGSNRLGK